jgi:cephalosporin hydroxylase
MSDNIITKILEVVPDYFETIKFTKWNKFKWKGLTLMKDPMSLTIYQQLIQDLKPKTILEFGAYEGGSALWMKDLCKSLNLNTRVITIDNNFNLNLKDIEFIKLDVNEIKNFNFGKLESPMIVIEDCHHNISGIVEKVDKFMKIGDFLIIEDSINFEKYNELKKINFKNFTMNRYYCDFWGKNNSWNYDSFLEKIKD